MNSSCIAETGFDEGGLLLDGGKVGARTCWLVVVVAIATGWLSLDAEAQTIGHRVTVGGGVSYAMSQGSDGSGGGLLGGRVYMGTRTPVFVWTDLHMRYGAVAAAAGLGGAALRSARARWLLRGGFFQGGYPIIGMGMEYGGTFAGFVELDYILTRTSWEEGVWFLKTGMYWGWGG